MLQEQLPSKPSILPDPFEWVYIPGGKVQLHYPPYNQVILVVVDVEPFFMAKYPVTNAQYSAYVSETGRKPEDTQFWNDLRFNQALQPVVHLRWHEAMMFSQWLSKTVGYSITLPTDVEWQRAAQGDDDRKYPWGNDWDTNRCNTETSFINRTTPVDQYPQGASPYGIMDMAGNVCEWCLTDAKTGLNSVDWEVVPTHLIPNDRLMEEVRIFRGSSYGTSTYSSDITHYGATPIFWAYLTGIRLVTAVR